MREGGREREEVKERERGGEERMGEGKSRIVLVHS